MTLSLTVTITTIHPGPHGGAIFSGTDAEGRRHRFVANNRTLSRVPVSGEIWSLNGELAHHPQYGPQIHVEIGIPVKPFGKLIVNYIAKNRAFDGFGIGQRKAERLWDKFGEDLYLILSTGDAEKLSQVLTEDTAHKLVGAWKSIEEEADILYLLAGYGFDVRLANKVRKVWPEDTIRKIRDNPYRMLAFSSWRKVDQLALALGISKDDPKRQVAAVEGCLYRRLDIKHTVTPCEVLLNEVSVALGTKARSDSQKAIDQALYEHAIVTHKDGYQPLGASVMERVIAERFLAMLAGSTRRQSNIFSGSLDMLMADSIASFEKGRGICVNTEQRAAVGMALKHSLGILTGGAGVGKTTVLKIIIDICEKIGTSVIQMALSGRASQRMREATGREAFTIAKFLRIAAGKFDPQGEPLVIIDESSMIDLPLMYSVIRALTPSARLLLVGDPYQLPPIGFGLIFHALAQSPNVPRVELTQVHRQARSSGIPQIAYSVRHGLTPQLASFSGAAPGVFFTDAEDSEIIDRINFVASQMKDCEDVQILGITKRGMSGVGTINATFHSIHSTSRNRAKGWEFAEEEPVIYLANDYKKELWNGSLGRITAVKNYCSGDTQKSTPQSLICTFEGTQHEIMEEDFGNIDLAYAITVHKAQGSQFTRVIIPISRSRLLDRTIIYTGLTRGVEQVIFVGDRRAFNQAIKTQPLSHERMVGFSI